LAAYAKLQGATLTVQALVATPDGHKIYRASTNGPAAQAQALGLTVAQELIEQGADVIIANLADNH
jgi:hydroxymethylbilane synthase